MEQLMGDSVPKQTCHIDRRATKPFTWYQYKSQLT